MRWVTGMAPSTPGCALVPAATPRSIVRKINADVVALLKQPAFRAKMTEIGLDPVGSTPDQASLFLQDEIAKWSKVITAAGVKPE